jgi:hypothetical protein
VGPVGTLRTGDSSLLALSAPGAPSSVCGPRTRTPELVAILPKGTMEEGAEQQEPCGPARRHPLPPDHAKPPRRQSPEWWVLAFPRWRRCESLFRPSGLGESATSGGRPPLPALTEPEEGEQMMLLDSSARPYLFLGVGTRCEPEAILSVDSDRPHRPFRRSSAGAGRCSLASCWQDLPSKVGLYP